MDANDRLVAGPAGVNARQWLRWPLLGHRDVGVTACSFLAATVLTRTAGWLAGRQRSSVASERFVPFSQRAYASDLVFSGQFVDGVQRGKRASGRGSQVGVNWHGLELWKDPFSVVAFPLLLRELKPRTILEFGTGPGGSASWLADLAQAAGLAAGIHTFDIDTEQLQLRRKEVNYYTADVRDLDSLAQADLAGLPHPWLVLEDSHTNLVRLLDHLHRYLATGDYVVVEDAIWPDVYQDLRSFMAAHSGDYMVDTAYCDLFGYNVTWHPNGYLRRR